ncbi:tyrosine-protein phosphatase [Lachnospiraceae bacterium OttesenSCG-928-D06]|nr:tyrosine-protein phosphatase [Lachnospiraceae bacterium OttesenSCG-928-D06]
MENKSKFSCKTLCIEGTINLRDLGGYIGYEGKTVKKGLLYRSDQLSQLTEKGLDAGRQLGIHTIIDLRSAPEIAKNPNKNIGAQKVILCNPAAETAELAASFQAGAVDEDRLLVEHLCSNPIKDPFEGILSQYQRFVRDSESIKAFSRFMKIVSEPNNAPLLFHCRGGKDRTGYGALLILAALGVSEEQIIADYMQTQINRQERTEEKMKRYATYTDKDSVLAYLRALLECRSTYIETSMNEMKEMEGSIYGYLSKVLGVTEEKRLKMQEAYLESGVR